MPTELNLRFPDDQHLIVRLGSDDDGSERLPFTNPLDARALADIRWYVETYGAHSLGDPDDSEATRIRKLLPIWGKSLFSAAFQEREAQRRFNSFQDSEAENRLLTISTDHPTILALPWELLHDSDAHDGTFLFHENPSISIRRRVAGADKGRTIYKPQAKASAHILFVVSRPNGAGFLDPRADAQPVLDAIDRHAPGRVCVEFLRPPTLDALLERLDDRSKPAVDILHFDGHGVFDRQGGMVKQASRSEGARHPFDSSTVKDRATNGTTEASPPNTGYLLFEDADGGNHLVSANDLGANLHRHKVGLVILSACQSAAVADAVQAAAETEVNPAMGSVAARLTATGIPAVLAMTHSVLVHTTQALFGEFYKHLAKQRNIGESLDLARRYLVNHPEKYEVQRGPDRLKLVLHDWFLPALYQQGADAALLTAAGEATASEPIRSNLPNAPEAGFYGRKYNLWQIERWFASSTRRITLTGFGGQGKTALAEEAGRWLTRTGLFRAAVFVDYSQVQATDAVAVAVSNIGSVLGESLPNTDAATTLLKQIPTLIILDNLEALAEESLQPLLEAAAVWSEAGSSRLLCTTRRPEFGHAAYKVEGTQLHRRIQLDGLGSKVAPDDALEWYAALMKLPPAPTVPPAQREGLIELFDRVRFHPLSIRVLTQQLKTRRVAELGERLDHLLTTASHKQQGEDTPIELLASLELSLDKLDDEARQVLPRLGVFQGGAMEPDLMIITGLGDVHQSQRSQLQQQLKALAEGSVRLEGDKELPPELVQELQAKWSEELAQLPPPAANLWPGLRRQLEAAALIEAEDVPGVSVPFLRFHPTLAPMLWSLLDATAQQRLATAHRQRYYALSGWLYHEDDKNPHQARAIAWRELPNLLHAVHATLDAGDPDAVDFADNVNRFLGTIFGLRQEAERLTARAQAAAGEAGSQAWVLAQSNRGEQLRTAGQVGEAAQIFQTLLVQLGEAPSYERAVTLGRLGRCFRAGGRPDLAAQHDREAITVCEALEQDDDVKRHRGGMLTDLADALRDQGDYAAARQAYQQGLEVVEELNDLRSQGVVLGQLGTLAMKEGNLAEAAEAHQKALALFQQLREPAMEAVYWHQLGVVFQEARQWDEAERHYRESARIQENRGNLASAARTWSQLAIVSEISDKPEAAEMWYRKAIEVDRAMGNPKELAPDLSNLADLLKNQPDRLAEARQLAEEALAIKQPLDPGAAVIWTTYSILAQIAEQEAATTPDHHRKAELQAEARTHRQNARQAKRSFAGTRHELKKHAQLIAAIVAYCAGQSEVREFVMQHQTAMRQGGSAWTAIADAIDCIIAGERDETTLCEGLELDQALIIETILTGLEAPDTLSDLLPSDAA